MKIPGLNGKRATRWTTVMGIAMAVLLCGLGVVYASSGGEHGGGGVGWTNKDWYRVMNFAVLAVALFFVLRKPLAQALGDRIKGIKQQLDDLAVQKQAAEKELAAYNEKLASLDKEAEEMIAEYIRQGEEAKKRILKEAESAADKLKEQASKNIENEFQRAKAQLQAEIVEKALVKAETAIKDRISKEDQNRLVDEYLDKVVA